MYAIVRMLFNAVRNAYTTFYLFLNFTDVFLSKATCSRGIDRIFHPLAGRDQDSCSRMSTG